MAQPFSLVCTDCCAFSTEYSLIVSKWVRQGLLSTTCALMEATACACQNITSSSFICPSYTFFSYKFWGSRIAQALESELQHSARSIKSAAPVIINAASQEYWRSVEGHLSPSVRVVTVQFPGPSVCAPSIRTTNQPLNQGLGLLIFVFAQVC